MVTEGHGFPQDRDLLCQCEAAGSPGTGRCAVEGEAPMSIRRRSFGRSMLSLAIGWLLAMLLVVGIGRPKPRPAHADSSDPIPLTSLWTPTTQVWQDPAT